MPLSFVLTRSTVPLSMPESLFPGTTTSTGDVGHALDITLAMITSLPELLPT